MTGFRAVAAGDAIVLTWNHIPDADLWGYEIRMGTTWETGLTVVDGIQESRTAWAPPMDGTYRFWIKALDRCGMYSANAAETAVSIDHFRRAQCGLAEGRIAGRRARRDGLTAWRRLTAGKRCPGFRP